LVALTLGRLGRRIRIRLLIPAASGTDPEIEDLAILVCQFLATMRTVAFAYAVVAHLKVAGIFIRGRPGVPSGPFAFLAVTGMLCKPLGACSGDLLVIS
jgi:hypothetical protein